MSGSLGDVTYEDFARRYTTFMNINTEISEESLEQAKKCLSITYLSLDLDKLEPVQKMNAVNAMEIALKKYYTMRVFV